MTDTVVVAVCGSLREKSYTRMGLETALEGAEAVGADTRLLDLREYDLPTLNPDRESQGDSETVTREIRESDSVLLGSPMYHGSYSGVLKNALDHCGFDEFEGTTIGLLAVSGGSFPLTALDHLRSVCRALDAWVLPHQAAVPNAHAAFSDGRPRDEGLDDRIRTLGRRAVEYSNIEPDPPTFESGHNEGA